MTLLQSPPSGILQRRINLRYFKVKVKYLPYFFFVTNFVGEFKQKEAIRIVILSLHVLHALLT